MNQTLIPSVHYSAYLEDILSDEEPMLDDTPPPKTPPTSVKEGCSKEELLVMMERVDRDISTTEQQISLLEKRKVSLLDFVHRLSQMVSSLA